MKSFEHGGQIKAFAQWCDCAISEVIDLSSNINFVKPKVNLDFSSLDISSYPTYDLLYETIAHNYGIKSENIELYNGGSSAIFRLFDAFKQTGLSHCTIYSPAYLEYKKAAQTFGYEMTLINRFNPMDEHIPKNSLVIFVNPSTPDGKYYVLEDLIQHWISKNATILIDESFLDFCENKSALAFMASYDKLYILKSMTKFYASAGIRIGTIVSQAQNIKRLKHNEPLWKLSQLDSHYLQEALKDESFGATSKQFNDEAKAYLKTILEKTSCIEKIFESDANFYLLKLKNINAHTFQLHLKTYKIMIRDCSNFDGLDETYVRIAVKSKEQLQVFETAMKALKV